MDDALILFRERGAAGLWQRTLGHFDLDMEQAMAIQRREMAVRLRTLTRGELGRRLLGSEIATIEEFRERVPLTSYANYESTLGVRDETVLAEQPAAWIRTSGHSSDRPKWIAMGPRQFDEMTWLCTAIFILSAARERGDVRLKPGAKVLNMTAPAPYASGTFVDAVAQRHWPMRLFPSPESANMDFAPRMAMAFGNSITEGVDFVAALPSVLAGLGESFGQRKAPGTILDRLKNPRAFARMGRAALRAKAAARPLYPKDALRPLGIPVGGGDSSLFRERIRQYWGVYPMEMFVSSEGLMVATQTWDRTSLTFVPTLNFLEFISEDIAVSESEESALRSETVLLDELEPGKNYELVLTNFFDGPMVRYRTGDVFRVVGRENPLSGVQMPQVVSYGRHSDTIDLAGFVKLTEQRIWQALEDADIPYVDWVARKEIQDSRPTLHVRIEPRPGSLVTPQAAYDRLNAALKSLEPDWADLETMAGLRPLRVTYLPVGAFDRYVEARRRGGADLGHLKPLHMNASDAALDDLLADVDLRPLEVKR